MINTGCSRLVPSQLVRPEKIETQVSSPQLKQFLAGALEQTTYTHSYDPAYVAIAYPGGDVPRETGVCTDVAIRAFRKISVDLQKKVHEDMKRNFAVYPQFWGLNQQFQIRH